MFNLPVLSLTLLTPLWGGQHGPPWSRPSITGEEMEKIQKIITPKCMRFILGAVATSFVFLPLSRVKLPSLCVCLRTETNQQKGQKLCFGHCHLITCVICLQCWDSATVASGDFLSLGSGNPSLSYNVYSAYHFHFLIPL